MQNPDGVVARVLRRQRREGPDARHQRRLLRRRPACGTTTSAPATPRSCASSGRWSSSTIDYALAYQTETGEIAWRADDPADGALLTGSSSIHLSLRCAIAIAERLGHERPDWELSLGALAIAIAHRPERFLDKQRWAMDWYYPILGGVLRGQAAQLRIAHYWDTFVVEGRGVRCVSDQPWVTAAETCELVMALDAIGETERAPRALRAGCSSSATTTAPTGAG